MTGKILQSVIYKEFLNQSKAGIKKKRIAINLGLAYHTFYLAIKRHEKGEIDRWVKQNENVQVEAA